MTLMLELPTGVEADLTAEAVRHGLPLQEYVLRLLSTAAHVPVSMTGAELVEYWRREGLVGTRVDITDSRQHARTLRESAERRDKA